MDSLLQAQQNVPVNLLLGTNTLHRLGFSLTASCPNPQQESKPEMVHPVETPAEVHLMRPARLPAGHSKVIWVKISGGLELTGKDFLFEPDAPCMDQEGLLIRDAIVGQDKHQETALVIANSSSMPVLLEEKELVGRLHGCEVFITNMPPSDINTKTVAAVQSRPAIDHHCLEKLQTELQLSSLDLSSAESSQLFSLFVEFAELFALDSTKLGRTSLVTHGIDTGDSPPMKQAPRRLPFSLRHHMSKLVDEMLTRGVIKSLGKPCGVGHQE